MVLVEQEPSAFLGDISVVRNEHASVEDEPCRVAAKQAAVQVDHVVFAADLTHHGPANTVLSNGEPARAWIDDDGRPSQRIATARTQALPAVFTHFHREGTDTSSVKDQGAYGNLATIGRCEALHATEVPPLVPAVLVLNITGGEVFFADQANNLGVRQHGDRVVQNPIMANLQANAHHHSACGVTQRLQHLPATLQSSAHDQAVAQGVPRNAQLWQGEQPNTASASIGNDGTDTRGVS